MREIKVEKVTLNIGAGANQDDVQKGVVLLTNITGKPPVKTLAKKRIAAWKIRPGLPVGVKATIRNEKEAKELLTRLLDAVDFEIYQKQFSENGFAFGIREYIEIPGVKYEPKIGIIGLDVAVSLKRPGYRIRKRKLEQRSIPKNHKISKEDSMKFATDELNVKVTQAKRQEIRGY